MRQSGWRALMMSGLALGVLCAQSRTVEIKDGWLLQDAQLVSDGGAAISKPGYAPKVYVVKPYAPPPTAGANPPRSSKMPDEIRYHPAPKVEGVTQWPVDPEKGRPNHSSQWVQAPGLTAKEWYQAAVPGTVLTTLVKNQLYPEPTYGENNRPNLIPESLCRTSYWYRTEFTVPAAFAGQQLWLNFEGINYTAEVWVNGQRAGGIRGAFARGRFNVTALAPAGRRAALAVKIEPPPHPGDPWEKTMANQRGPNGGGLQGPLGLDGPTFLASIGWDWVPGVRDRQMGIWQKVTLSATGPVLLEDPFVTTAVPLPRTDTAEVAIEVSVRNVSAKEQSGRVSGRFGEAAFSSEVVKLAAGEAKKVRLDAGNTAALRLSKPRLWWPNGFGEPYLYGLQLKFEQAAGLVSDQKEMKIGVRQVSYFVEGSKMLTLSVNGVRVFAKGGNWGMDEMLKRIPRERLEAQVRLHRDANYTMIRNWVGQSTTEDLYDLCDKYGILMWDEFFQANPANGLDPLDNELYLANVREKILRFRNHASIVIWCGRNEGAPPPVLDKGIADLLRELDPQRYYQSSSTAGNGVVSGGAGGYGWREPRLFYGQYPVFNTEVGAAAIPTLEAIESWMPEKDRFDMNFPNDTWALRCLVGGNGNPVDKPFEKMITQRYGAYGSLADFVRKAQMANYEAYRAMYEARMSRLFDPSTAILVWMSNPAQPSFVWQIYDYTLEPFSAFFAVQKACEPVHVMMTQDDFRLMIVNHSAKALEGFKYRVRLLNLDGTTVYDQTRPAPSLPVSKATELGPLPVVEGLSPVHFVKLELVDAAGRRVSENFYWKEARQDDLRALERMPEAELEATVARRDENGRARLIVTLRNPGRQVAVLTHLQLRHGASKERVLPVFYSDNYVSLAGGESRAITIEAAAKDLGAALPLLLIDGWNVKVKGSAGPAAAVQTNEHARVRQ